jgi:4'-phosphopantetheinyl transferase
MFNLAHSGDLALVAVAEYGELGIDVEGVRPKVSEEGIAERFFSAREVNAIRSLPPASQADAFFRCWTRKEAFIKAVGKGLSFGLGQFTVSVAANAPAALLETAFDPSEARSWTLHHIDPAPGYIGALAVPWVPKTVHYWRFQ